MDGKSVLIVEDDEDLLGVLTEHLSRRGFQTLHAAGVTSACDLISSASPAVILCDYSLNDGNAFELLAWLRGHNLVTPIVVMTGHATIELAVQAIKYGAEQFVTKPVDMEVLATLLRRVLEHQRIDKKQKVQNLQTARYERDPFAGGSAAIQQLRGSAERVAGSDSTVLLQGETGTGKGVLARWLHQTGARKDEPFVDVNCAGLSRELLESELFGYQRGAFTGAVSNKEGLLEAAHRGTLFLDEIGDMDPMVQSKLLKVVEDKRFHRLGDVRERMVDVRIIAASHCDLKKLVEQGRFRSDLYFRISPIELRIPPLRERPEDILTIAEHLLVQLGKDLGVGPLQLRDSAIQELLCYSWPGNIRELRNVLERAALFAEMGIIRSTGLKPEKMLPAPAAVAPSQDLLLTLDEVEQLHIRRIFEAEGGNVIRAAARLGIAKSSLYAKIRQYGLMR
ncbi:MAG: sigma-54 dependent transcriptional regulator [Acidobacteriota bacterium]|nr:sigma-54 dependent transcriptional regulator [Acidobacteriota bacterium]